MTEKEPEALVAFIGSQRAEHNIPYRVTCRVLRVSEAWFYKWRRRPAEPTKREVRRMELEERVRHFFRLSGETYGSPRITLDLWAEGWKVSVNTVAEIMAGLGLQGRKPPRRRKSLTRQGKRKAAPDLVHRRFDAVAPDLLWYGDMTEIETGATHPAIHGRPLRTSSRKRGSVTLMLRKNSGRFAGFSPAAAASVAALVPPSHMPAVRSVR